MSCEYVSYELNESFWRIFSQVMNVLFLVVRYFVFVDVDAM